MHEKCLKFKFLKFKKQLWSEVPAFNKVNSFLFYVSGRRGYKKDVIISIK